MKGPSKLRSVTAVLATSCFLGFGSAASAEQLRLAVGFPTGAYPDAAEVYADAVERYSDGELSVRVFELSLLNLAEMSDGVGSGIADAGVVLTPYFPSQYPHINFAADLSMMLALENDLGGKEGWAYGGAMLEFVMHNCPECLTEIHSQNQIYTGGGASPRYGLLCNEPVRTLDDIEGKRLRAGAAPWARWAEHFDASPVTLPGNEILEGLNQGVIDCVIISATELSGLRLRDATTDITMDVPGGVFAGGNAPSVNADRWAGLNDEQREALLRAGAVFTAQVSYRYSTYADENIAAAKEQGITLHEADEELVAASQAFIEEDLRKTARHYREEYGVEDGEEIVATMNSLVDKWVELVADVDDPDELAQLYWDEVYSDLDPSAYGLR